MTGLPIINGGRGSTIQGDSLVVGGVRQFPAEKFPLTAAEVVALTARAGLNGGAGLTPTLLSVAVGMRFRDMLGTGKHLVPAGVTTADRWRTGGRAEPLAPGRSIYFQDSIASRMECSDNTFFDVTTATTANNMMVLATYWSTSADVNVGTLGKAQNPPTWQMGVTAAGEARLALWATGAVNIDTAGGVALLRDGDYHIVGAKIDYSLAVGSQGQVAAERGNTGTGSLAAITALGNTGKLALGGDSGGSATHSFGCDYVLGFRGAQLNGVTIKSVMAALGWTVTGS